jgi:hypothetical protein
MSLEPASRGEKQSQKKAKAKDPAKKLKSTQLPLAGQSDTDEVTKGKDHAKLKKTKQNSTANLPQKIASKPRQDGKIAKNTVGKADQVHAKKANTMSDNGSDNEANLSQHLASKPMQDRKISKTQSGKDEQVHATMEDNATLPERLNSIEQGRIPNETHQEELRKDDNWPSELDETIVEETNPSSLDHMPITSPGYIMSQSAIPRNPYNREEEEVYCVIYQGDSPKGPSTPATSNLRSSNSPQTTEKSTPRHNVSFAMPSVEVKLKDNQQLPFIHRYDL